MVIVPFAFNVNPVGIVITVKTTCEGITATPFKVSFVKTLAVVLPVYPFIGPKVSAIASTGQVKSTVTATFDGLSHTPIV